MNGYGMMWHDNDTKITAVDRAKAAAEYYKTKYGKTATICLVHPVMILQQTPFIIDGLEFQVSRSVLPNNFWIGEK